MSWALQMPSPSVSALAVPSALTACVEHIIGRAGIAIVAGRTDLSGDVRAVVLSVADAIAIAVRAGRAHALAAAFSTSFVGARVAVVAGGTDLARHVRAVVLRVADAIAIAVRAGRAHALTARVEHIIGGAGVAVVAAGTDLSGEAGAVVLCVADTITVAVGAGRSHALAAALPRVHRSCRRCHRCRRNPPRPVHRQPRGNPGDAVPVAVADRTQRQVVVADRSWRPGASPHGPCTPCRPRTGRWDLRTSFSSRGW